MVLCSRWKWSDRSVVIDSIMRDGLARFGIKIATVGIGIQ